MTPPHTVKAVNMSVTTCLFVPLVAPPCHPTLGQPLIYFLLLQVSLHFLEFYVSGIMQLYTLFWWGRSGFFSL